MKAMPLPFEEFQGKGVLDFSSSSSSSCSDLRQHQQQQQFEFEFEKNKWQSNKAAQQQQQGWCYVGTEPTSVLDARRSPSPPTSSSTLSSSLGGGGGSSGAASTDTSGVAPSAAAAAAVSVNHQSSLEEKCGMGMEDWESVFSGSPSQEQSILKLILGDVEDPSMGLSKILQPNTGGSHDLEFGAVDQGFGFESIAANIHTPDLSDSMHPGLSSNLLASSAVIPPPQHQPQGGLDEKPQILNPQMIINQNQALFTQNPAMFMPLPYAQLQEHNVLSPPPSKRLNSGSGAPNFSASGPKVQFSGSGQELYLRRQQQQLQLLQQRASSMGMASGKPKNGDEMANQQLQQAVIDQLFKAAELIETGNPVLAQGILARLNHQLSPSPAGKPFLRAAFYLKEALQVLLLHMNSNSVPSLPSYNIIFKIGAYKSFSEISPIVQFANFTSNQALLEAFEGFDKVHVIDFDLGYGGQWASLMQELVLRNGGAPSLKITAFASPSSHDAIELTFTHENLKQFASEINMPFDIEILSMESLNSTSWQLPLHVPENEAIAVNLPIGSFSSYPGSLPLVLRFVKQLSPKVVVSLDRGCDRTDVPFPHHIINALQSYSGLLDSLDASNVNLDALQKIERFLLQPGVEKIVVGRYRSLERTPSWRSLFLQSGFSPLAFSNFTESQAECLVQRTPIRGFHVEKKQSSLVLCWQRRELIAASAWRC